MHKIATKQKGLWGSVLFSDVKKTDEWEWSQDEVSREPRVGKQIHIEWNYLSMFICSTIQDSFKWTKLKLSFIFILQLHISPLVFFSAENQINAKTHIQIKAENINTDFYKPQYFLISFCFTSKSKLRYFSSKSCNHCTRILFYMLFRFWLQML